MTRTLLIADGIAALLAAAGIVLLARPAAGRWALRLSDSEAAGYGLRILGAMLLAAGLFCAGFTTMFWWASGGAA